MQYVITKKHQFFAIGVSNTGLVEGSWRNSYWWVTGNTEQETTQDRRRRTYGIGLDKCETANLTVRPVLYFPIQYSVTKLFPFFT